MGRGPRHRSSKLENRSRYLATRPTDELKNGLACEIAGYERIQAFQGEGLSPASTSERSKPLKRCCESGALS